MLRFGYHLLFWNAYLQEEATQNPQLVRENPPLYGQIIIFTQLVRKTPHFTHGDILLCQYQAIEVVDKSRNDVIAYRPRQSAPIHIATLVDFDHQGFVINRFLGSYRV